MLTSYHVPHPQEKCHQYWPAERSARYQYFVVDPMAEYNMPQYILREFKVTDARVSAAAGSPAQPASYASVVPRPVKGACSSSWRNWKARCSLALQAEGAAAPHLLLLSLEVPSLPAVAAPVSSSGIRISIRPCLACAAYLGKHLTQAPLHLESPCAPSDWAQDPV